MLQDKTLIIIIISAIVGWLAAGFCVTFCKTLYFGIVHKLFHIKFTFFYTSNPFPSGA